MIPTSLLLTAALAAAPTLSDERPLWAGSLQPTSEAIVVAAVPAGIGVRSARAAVAIGGDPSGALGAGLCTGAAPRLAIPAGGTVHLLGPGTPVSLVARVTLPAQAISAAVPVVAAAGCRIAVVLQSGDVALVDASGGLTTLPQVIPAVADGHELPRGVLVASRGDLLVAGGADGSLAAVQLSDGRRFSGRIPVAGVPGAVWSRADGSLWFLSRTGSLFAWKVAADAPVLVAEGSAAAPGGLVAWGGRTDHGIAWADMQGQVFAWKDGARRLVARLPAGVRWPMLVADLQDSGDLELVAAVDGAVAARVTEQAAGGSFRLVELAGRPAGAPVAYQLAADQAAVLAVPAGATRGSLLAGDGAPAGQLDHDQAILVSGAQLTARSPGPVMASLIAPAGSGLPGGTGGASTTGGGSATQAPAPKAGFSCATAPAGDVLAVILVPFLLLRLLGRRPQGRSGVTNDADR